MFDEIFRTEYSQEDVAYLIAKLAAKTWDVSFDDLQEESDIGASAEFFGLSLSHSIIRRPDSGES